MAPWGLNRHRRESKSSQNESMISKRVDSTSNLALDGSPVLATDTGRNNNEDGNSTDYDAPSTHKRRRPFHVRSMSNPFPGLFSGKRSKKKRSDSTTRLLQEPQSSDNEPTMKSPRNTTSLRGDAGHAEAKDLTTGICMTCGSTMRWPKALDTFKCSICVTINDLVPLGTQQSRERKTRDRRGRISNDPISLEYTRRITRQCLRAHLFKQLCTNEEESKSKQASTASSEFNTAALYNEDQVLSGGNYGPTLVNEPELYIPRFVFNEQPTLRPNPLRQSQSNSASYSASPRAPTRDARTFRHERTQSHPGDEGPQRIFKPLEDYLIDCFSSFDRINESFFLHHMPDARRSRSEYHCRSDTTPMEHQDSRQQTRTATRERPFTDPSVCQVDPKILLLGDFAENGTWWAGSQNEIANSHPTSMARGRNDAPLMVSQKSPDLNWVEVTDWYSTIINAANGWFPIYEELSLRADYNNPTESVLQVTEKELLEAQAHVQRVLLKATETLLKRLGGRISEADHLRFLLIVLENPLLQANPPMFGGLLQGNHDSPAEWPGAQPTNSPAIKPGPSSGQHSGIIKRIVGLISNAPDDCHNYLISWFARYHVSRFTKLKDLVYSFLTYRMLRQNEKKHETRVDITAGLIPHLQAGRSGAFLHDEIGPSRRSQRASEQPKSSAYSEDWQVRAATRTLSLFFSANNFQSIRRGDQRVGDEDGSGPGANRSDTLIQGPFIPNTDFYNSMTDFVNLVGDFEIWESRRDKFSFCQYPFLLSIWAKTKILEHDAQRQMQTRARDAFFDSIMSRRTISQYLALDVRRECLVDDSLQAVSEVIGSGSEDVKKALRITFRGEEGVDGGGLRKEWFLLLVREVFNPDHGMFVYDEESQYCYFNPYSWETSDQFYLVGVVMGLAIYNSTILDVALPPFAFRKLLASAPAAGAGAGHSMFPRQGMRYTLEDLMEYRPGLARGLRQLLDHDGDVEEFGLGFAIDTDKYGAIIRAPLCEKGENRTVTNDNRREYVDLYVRYVLDTAVVRQFEPFKRGFYTVCGGNAFSLFRAEEIELLIRGSDGALDVGSLRAVAMYDNWGIDNPDGIEAVVGWFWETFQAAAPKDQRKMLSFITGSDRLPATGASMMPIKISCLGDDSGRYPSARTCFNLLSLPRYRSKQKLEFFLWRAVHDSEGFGLK